MNLDFSYLQERLKEAKYEPELGVRLIQLTPTEFGGVKTILIAIQLDPGKRLVPHLHEKDGEICIPLTEGIARLGDAKKDEKGDYIVEEDKVAVDWEEEMILTPGKSFDMPAGKAHWLYAYGDKPFVLFFVLPESHLGIDRRFVTYPPEFLR